MSDKGIAIDIVNLGKQYQIGALEEAPTRLGEQLTDALLGPVRRIRRLFRGELSSAAELDMKIWALRDISLKVREGEVLGVIGRNGAGKSTMLKVLSRITEPTEGYVDIFGRVGSLLEVGTGFHPELTGRENIYLNGAILGMQKHEIEDRFDEIVDFAEIETFIETPVKHYSSGMFVRLAFSVAAHMNPEILLIDEVLAVGDVAFQKKCLGKMGDVAEAGRTVLFVSHNMGLVQSLCDRGILLESGQLVADGPISEVVKEYLRMIEVASAVDLRERKDRLGVGNLRLVDVRVSSTRDGLGSTIQSGGGVEFRVQTEGRFPDMHCTLEVFDHLGQPVTAFVSKRHSPNDIRRHNSEATFICRVEELYLLPGRYRLDVSVIGDNRLQDSLKGAATFNVAEGNVDGRPTLPDRQFRVAMPHRWILPRG